ncbi:hypothetical protein CPLU01_03057 [Colletotrichum plurivorum]|uniref:Uncharacterized protein n=1 Tax=Colletotrichum plurivorum TaxID=2175906 RepID=A0A8H6KU96_9PEZI|nr:hypothetical protein CPLU01_03057 [Colletotrichum plurivorum]
MPSLRDLNKQDETASKVPSRGGGLEAFTAGGGYAVLICCPVLTIVGIGQAVVVHFKKKKDARTERKEAMNGTTQQSNEGKGGAARGSEEKEAVEVERASAPGRRDVEPNPRVCRPDCPGYVPGKTTCAMHRGHVPEGPESPGLLAV